MFKSNIFTLFVLCCQVQGFDDKSLADLSAPVYFVPTALGELEKNITYVKENKLNKREPFPLELPRPDYDIPTSALQHFFTHSLLGFCSQSLVTDHICYCNDKFHNVTVFGNLEVDSRAAVGVDKLNSLIVVSYRQSISATNWKLTDETELVNYPAPKSKEKVHKGILKYFQSVQQATEDRVLELFDDPQYVDFTLHVTGYGMGGTAAIISMPAWIRLLQKNRIANRSQFYAYSSFRPGNLAFAQYIESLKMPLVRYTRKGDIVPHLPDQNLSYSQAGQEFYDSEDAPFASPHLTKCSNKALEDLHCSLNNTEFSATSHLFPFNKPIPGFPLC